MGNIQFLRTYSLLQIAFKLLKKKNNKKKLVLLKSYVKNAVQIKSFYEVFCFITLLLYTEGNSEDFEKNCPIFTLSYTMESPIGFISNKLYIIPIIKNTESNLHFIVFENENDLNKEAYSYVISTPPCTLYAPMNFFLSDDLPPEKSLYSVFEPIQLVLDQFIINMNPTLIDCNSEVTLLKVEMSTIYKNYQPFY